VPDRPYTIMSCAVSLDGCLDDTSPERLILSGPEDLDEVDELRATADAILVGAGTIRADNPRLLIRDERRAAARERAGRPPHPLRVTVTASGDLDPAARFFAGPRPSLVYAASAVAAATADQLKGKAVVIDAGAELSLAAVLEDLYSERVVLTLLAEPGSQLARDLLAENLVDELRLAVAPFFVGDPAAPRFGAPAPYRHGPAAPMTLVSVRRLGDLAVAHYKLSPRAARG
jgi:5-amino-6-(5-phosphoribosylamino)uracil reductase